MNNLAFQIYGLNKTGIFQSTWKTDNAGVSSSTQIELPLLSGGTYNFWIDWGDGSTTNVTSYSQRTHTYASTGTYTLRAIGTVGIWRFAGGGDKLKILTVSSWGKLILGAESFFGCANLNLSAVSDTPNLTSVTDLNRAFRGCATITTVNKFTDWNTNLVTNFREIFYGCTNFNQDVGALNVSGAVNLDSFFMNCVNFNNGGSSSINNWNVSNVGSYGSSGQGIFAGCINFNQPLGNWNVSNTTIFLNMFNGAIIFNQDLSTWNISKGTNFISMFQNATAFNNGANTNTNAITGRTGINGWNINTVSNVTMAYMFNAASIFNRDISSWNVSKVTSMVNVFNNCASFNNGYASGIANQLTWNTSECTNMQSMFQSAPAFNSNLGTGTTPWDVSKVTSFASMFFGATNFNNGDETTLSKINDWSINTVSNVNMASMFVNASIFNRDISGWNVSKVTTFESMFQQAILFNNGNNTNINPITLRSGIDGWDTSSVISMSAMFYVATTFNRDIGSWNVTKVTDFSGMFQIATAFNNGGSSSINNWIINTSANVSMNSMFNQNASSVKQFNQPIGNWNVSRVTDMSSMFNANSNGGQLFNQNLNTWNVSNVKNMSFMFSGAQSFNNGNLSGLANQLTWDTSSCTNMANMFAINPAFNSNLGTGTTPWNVSNVTNMSYMFYNDTATLSAFNQNIGAWDISKVTNFTGFMYGKTPSNFSSTNLDAIYNGWIVNGVKPNINISFGGAKYTAAGVAGRLTLTSAPNNWIIQDGGL